MDLVYCLIIADYKLVVFIHLTLVIVFAKLLFNVSLASAYVNVWACCVFVGG